MRKKIFAIPVLFIVISLVSLSGCAPAVKEAAFGFSQKARASDTSQDDTLFPGVDAESADAGRL